MFLPFTKDVIMELQFVHIAEADDVLVSQAIHSVLDVLPDDSPVPERMWSRVAAIREGNYPAACELLVVHNKAVGWAGSQFGRIRIQHGLRPPIWQGDFAVEACFQFFVAARFTLPSN